MTNPVSNSGPNNVHLNTQQGTPSASLDQAATLPDPLTSMIMSDDLIAQVVGLMSQSFRQDRKDSKKLANNQEQAIAKETKLRVAQMRESAEQARKAAFVSGVSMMIGGGLQVAGAGLALGSSGGSEVTKTTTDASGVATSTKSVTAPPNWDAFGSGGRVGSEGLGKLVASGHEDASRAADEAAVLHESAADRSTRASEEHRADADDARRMLDKVAEFLKSVRDSQNATAQAAIRRA